MKLGEKVIHGGLEEVFLYGSVPVQSPWDQWLWWQNWVWPEHKSCLSSGCTEICHLVRGWGWNWRGWGRSQVWASASSSLLGGHHIPFGGLVGLKFLKSQRRAVLEQEGLVCLFGKSQCVVYGGLATLRHMVSLWCAVCANSSNGCPLPAQAWSYL